MLHDLEPGGVRATASYEPDAATLQVTVGTSEAVAPGIFHKLTGALTSQGLEIRSAQIHTLADGLVLDRFWVHDPDYAGEPPARPDRSDQPGDRAVAAAGQRAGARRSAAPGSRGEQRKLLGPKPQIRVNTDNSTSDRYTIIDVFAYDRTGLLYAVTRTLVRTGLFGLAGEDQHLPRPGARRLLRDRPGRQQDRGPGTAGGDSQAAAGGDWRRSSVAVEIGLFGRVDQASPHGYDRI